MTSLVLQFNGAANELLTNLTRCRVKIQTRGGVGYLALRPSHRVAGVNMQARTLKGENGATLVEVPNSFLKDLKFAHPEVGSTFLFHDDGYHWFSLRPLPEDATDATPQLTVVDSAILKSALSSATPPAKPEKPAKEPKAAKAEKPAKAEKAEKPVKEPKAAKPKTEKADKPATKTPAAKKTAAKKDKATPTADAAATPTAGETTPTTDAPTNTVETVANAAAEAATTPAAKAASKSTTAAVKKTATAKAEDKPADAGEQNEASAS